MKNHLIISLLILSVGFSQQKKSDEPNPKKGIKTETRLEYEYEEKFGELEVILEGKYISKYDSNGNKVERSNYHSDESLNWKYIYKYDSNGNKVEWLEYDLLGSLSGKSIYKYDSKNRIIESISYDLESKFGELQEIPTNVQPQPQNRHKPRQNTTTKHIQTQAQYNHKT